MNRPPLLYFASNGLGENLQASPAMRRLKLAHTLYVVAKMPVHLAIHPDCYDRMFAFTSYTINHMLGDLKLELAKHPQPVPYSHHLDAFPEIRSELEDLGFITPKGPRLAPADPCSASRVFWHRVVGKEHAYPRDQDGMMIAAYPDIQRDADYDVLVSTGSSEKMRRLLEHVAVAICNQLHAQGYRVCLHTAGGRPDTLRAKIGCALNRWSDGTMTQLKELVYGSRVIVSPDSGPVHLALAYGRKVLFLESREDARQVIDPLHNKQVTVYRMHDAPCLQNCSARRPKFDQWPKSPNRAGEKDYPHNLECGEADKVPCLLLPPDAIKTLCALPIFQ